MSFSEKNIYKRNAETWEHMAIHGMHPDIHLIKAQKALFPDGKGKKLLSIGFGEGQDLLHFAKEGFMCSGVELAENRIAHAKELLAKSGFNAEFKRVDSPRLPFDDNTFDVVVAWQSLYYNSRETLTESLAEVFRVLKSGGQFLSSMVSTKHNLCAEEIAPSLYRPSRTPSQQDAILYCFDSEDEIRNIYGQFSDIKIGHYDTYLFKTRDFHYVIACNK